MSLFEILCEILDEDAPIDTGKRWDLDFDRAPEMLEYLDLGLEEVPPQKENAIDFEELLSFNPNGDRGEGEGDRGDEGETPGIPIGWEPLFQEKRSQLKRMGQNLRRKKAAFHGVPVSNNRLDSLPDCHYPLIRDTFTAYHLLPTKLVNGKRVPDVSVVILGQDPYFTEKNGVPTAMGASFWVRDGHSTNRSLQNIFKRMVETGNLSKVPDHGNLSSWVRQGVFLLNTALTVPTKEAARKENPNAKSPAKMHLGGWRGWTEATIQYLTKYNPHCVFCLWGRDAQNMETILPTTVVRTTCTHPSPLAYDRGKEPFSQSDQFNEINDYLVYKLRKPPICWESVNFS